ncbi:hypothetical protein BH11PLA2_BH11PLA2_11740 [soil metagenome]
MKQKNLILMVVAVGCGLLAAFLTSQMSAKPAAVAPQIKVLVVAKELPPGTKFTLDSIKDQFKEKMINAEAIPEKAVVTEDMFDGKTLNKTLRADDFVRESDLGNYQHLDPPEGKHVITVKLPIDKITPFVAPASRVDVMGTALAQDGKIKAAILIPNMLVMATDIKVANNNGAPQGEMTIQLVSIAVSNEEAIAIRACEAANVKLSFILRSDNTKSTTEFDLAKVINWVNGDDTNVKVEKDPLPTPTEPAKDLVKIYVPTGDLPAGTELTSDVLTTKFKEIQWQGTLPANAIEKIKDHVGRFVVKDIYGEVPVPKQCLADALPKKEVVKDPPVAKAGDGAAPLLKAEPPKEPEKKKALPTFDRSFTTPTGTKVYRYEVDAQGELRILGEVTTDGSLVPATNAPPPSKPKEENKDETAPKKVS